MAYNDEAVFVLKYQKGKQSVFLVKHAETLSDVSQITTSLQLPIDDMLTGGPARGHVSVTKHTNSNGDILDHIAVCIADSLGNIQIWSTFTQNNAQVVSEYSIISYLHYGCEAINAGSDGKSYALTLDMAYLLQLVEVSEGAHHKIP